MTEKKRDPAPERTAGQVRKRGMPAENLDKAIAARAYEIYRKRGIAVSDSEELLKDWEQAEREIREARGLS